MPNNQHAITAESFSEMGNALPHKEALIVFTSLIIRLK